MKKETVKKTDKPIKTTKKEKEIEKIVAAPPVQEVNKIVVDSVVEAKLKSLYTIQKVDSEYDKIKIMRGELPLEVKDLEDEIIGTETRINNFKEELQQAQEELIDKKNKITEAEDLVKKYTKQQNNVKNNREFDALTKEIEYQNLEIELCNKKIKQANIVVSEKKEIIDDLEKSFEEKISELEQKKVELNEIISDTKKEEEELMKKSKELEKQIEERLLIAYKKIRKNVRNGIAVATFHKDACSGCFNKIPLQRQMEIRMRKKIIICEYCGRILVDEAIANEI